MLNRDAGKQRRCNAAVARWHQAGMRISALRRKELVIGWTVALIAVVGLIALVASLASNGSGSSRKSASSGDATAIGRGLAAAAPMPGTGATAPRAPTAPAASGSAAPLQSKDFVRTATLQLSVTDVDTAAEAVIAHTTELAGQVQQDDRSGSGTGRSASLVMRVLPQNLDALVIDVSSLGKELDRTITGTDVTAAHADVDARVRALQTSVTRLNTLLSHSGSINDLIQLENQLSARQSELDSTVAQQKSLVDQIQLATLTVQLSQTPPPPPPVQVRVSSHGPAGFGAALAAGWHAVTVAWRWTAATLGYVLPSLAIACLIGIPALLIRRRRIRAGSPRPMQSSAEATP